MTDKARKSLSYIGSLLGHFAPFEHLMLPVLYIIGMDSEDISVVQYQALFIINDTEISALLNLFCVYYSKLRSQ